MEAQAAARLKVMAAALLFSTGGVAIKSCSLSSWEVAGFRSGIAALAVLVLLPGARRGWSVRTPAVGLAYAATLICFVLANKLTTAANTIYLQSTAPLYLLLLSPWLLREPIRTRELGFAAALAVGLGLFFVDVEQPSVTAPDPFRGNLLATLSGLFWALTLTGLRWLARGGDAAGAAQASAGTGATAVVAGNVAAFLICLPWMLPLHSIGMTDLLILAYLGIVQIGLAYMLLTTALGQVPAFEAGLLLLVEPVFNPVWAGLVHSEVPGFWSLLGAGTILAATAVKSWLDFRALAKAADIPASD